MLEQCTTRLARFFTTKRFKAFNISSLQSVSTNQIDDTMAQDAERFQYFHLPRLSLSSAGTGCGVSNGPASVSALPPPRAADHVGSGRDGAGGTRRTLTFFPRM